METLEQNVLHARYPGLNPAVWRPVMGLEDVNDKGTGEPRPAHPNPDFSLSKSDGDSSQRRGRKRRSHARQYGTHPVHQASSSGVRDGLGQLAGSENQIITAGRLDRSIAAHCIPRLHFDRRALEPMNPVNHTSIHRNRCVARI
jgi:hypothetical protein